MLTTPENVILLYGAGGAGKSTWCCHQGAYIWKTTGKKTRIVGMDGGGYKPYIPLLSAGAASYLAVEKWDERNLFTTLERLSKGYWPEDVDEPNSELLPPTSVARLCPLCEAEIPTKDMPKACPSCKKVFPPGMKIKRKVSLQNGAEDVGLVVFEGATAFGMHLMKALKVAEPEGGMVVKLDDGGKVSQSGQHHYGIGQSYLADFINNSRHIPTNYVTWTALEFRGDDGYGKPTYGPAFPGKKMTSQAIPWFTDVIHLELEADASRTAAGVEILRRRLFMAKHFPSDTKPYGFEAKTSVTTMPPVLDWVEGKNGAEIFFTEQKKALDRATKALLG